MSNKAFTKSNIIELDDDHYLENDGDNGIILICHQLRERKNKKTEEMEEYLFEERTYHPRIVQALKHFVDKTQNESKTLKELMAKVDYNTQLLDRLDKEFRQFE